MIIEIKLKINLINNFKKIKNINKFYKKII